MVIELVDQVDRLTTHLLAAEIEDRLAASAPYLTMVSVMVCGWLTERLLATGHPSGGIDIGPRFSQTNIGNYYLSSIVPEASGLRCHITNGSKFLSS